MKFKYLDITPQENSADETYKFDAVAMLKYDSGVRFSSESVFWGSGTTLSKYDTSDILAAVSEHGNIITVNLTDKSKKAVKSLIEVLKPAQNIFVSQVLLASGSTGVTSVFCDNSHLAVVVDGYFCKWKIKDENDWDKVIRTSLGFTPITKNSYKQIATEVASSQDSRKELDSNLRLINLEKSRLRGTITSLAPEFSKSKKLRVLLDSRLALETHFDFISIFMDHKIKTINFTEKVKELSDAYNLVVKSFVEERDNIAEIDLCRKNLGSDWRLFNRLKDNGTIESVCYSIKQGLRWVYPPMTYEVREDLKVFLGRVEVALLLGKITFKFISYLISDYSAVGTWHIKSNGEYCPGEFKLPIASTICKGRIGELILIIKDLIKSSNEGNMLHSPDWKVMSIDNPQVIDDSFKVWKEGLCKIK